MIHLVQSHVLTAPQLTERVIVDHDGFNLYSVDAEHKMLSVMSDAMGPMGSMMSSMIREPPVQGGNFEDEYSDFDHIPADKHFNELQAQLSLSTLKCCVLRSRKWFNITVGNLKPVEWKSQAFEHLVLEGPTKNTLRGLVQQHKRSKTLKHTMSDVIPSKGEVCTRGLSPMQRSLTTVTQGLVIVLHGPPGVGKTLTAGMSSENSTTQMTLLLTAGISREYCRVYPQTALFNQHWRLDSR